MFSFRHYEQDYKNLTYHSSMVEKFVSFMTVIFFNKTKIRKRKQLPK